jgi:hypothetical protein
VLSGNPPCSGNNAVTLAPVALRVHQLEVPLVIRAAAHFRDEMIHMVAIWAAKRKAASAVVGVGAQSHLADVQEPVNPEPFASIATSISLAVVATTIRDAGDCELFTIGSYAPPAVAHRLKPSGSAPLLGSHAGLTAAGTSDSKRSSGQ